MDLSFFKLKIDIVQNIIKDYTHLANSGKIIILCWIPSHVNIHSNIISCVSEFCLDEWQDIWDLRG